jgi:4-hydroxybenzoate polyprenyltransferase
MLTLREKTASYLELVRLPHIFIIIADPLAGFIAASPTGIDIFKLPYLLASSALIYAGGSALNDFADRGHDPADKPIPSGRVSPGGALSLGAVLIIAGVLSASAAGAWPLIMALGLSAAAIAYNAGLKGSLVSGAVTMAISRALNLSLGLSAGSPGTGVILLLPLIIFAFVFAITLLRRLSGPETLFSGIGALSGWIAACAAIQVLIFSGFFMREGLLFAAMFYVTSGAAVVMALSGKLKAEGAMRALVLSIPLLDAAFSAGTGGITAGLPVAALALPAIVLSKKF